MSISALATSRQDVALAALLVAGGELQVALLPDPAGPRIAVALQTLLVAGVAVRRRRPLLAAALAAFGGALTLAIHPWGQAAPFVVAQIVGALLVTYAAGAHEPERRRAVSALGLLLAAYWLNDLREGNPASEYLASAVLNVGPWAAGRVVGLARRQAGELRAANAQLAEERARAQASAAAAERARIARELHDIVAHSLSVIALQADAAAALIHVRPADAEQRVDAVRRTAQGALHEMRRLLGNVRGRDGETAGASLRELGRLVDTAREAGADVALELQGAPTALPAAIDVSAYRIVQEALTNARRHAGGAACAVRVDYAPEALALSVANVAPPGERANAAAPPGFGLVGVRERVAALGGTLRVGPAADGGWRLEARIPLGGPPA